MSRRKKLELYYGLTQTEILPPNKTALARKDKFIKDIQKTVEADYKPKTIKLTYEVVNEEVERQRRFFHTCIKWYAIQNEDMFEEEPSHELLRQYRDYVLDELLGFDVVAVNKTIRKRTSTTTYKDVQEWDTLIKMFEETLFAKGGYEFPDSKKFWAMIDDDNYSYEQADRIIRERLQKTIKAKLYVAE